MATKRQKTQKKKPPVVESDKTPARLVIEESTQGLAITRANANKDQDYVRMLAGVLYATDTDGGTIASIARHPILSTVGTATLQRWSTEDSWAAKRAANYAEWAVKINERIGNELVQQRLAALEKLHVVENHIFAHLTAYTHEYEPGEPAMSGGTDPVDITRCKVCNLQRIFHDLDPFGGMTGLQKAKSLETIAKLQTDAMDRLGYTGANNKEDDEGNLVVTPDQERQILNAPIKDKERRAVAETILRLRLDEMRTQLAAERDKPNED